MITALVRNMIVQAVRTLIPGSDAAYDPLGPSLDLDFTTGSYRAAAVGNALVNVSLASVVTNPGTVSGTGMAITASDDATVPLGSWWQQSEGTIYVHGVISYTNDSFPRLFELSSGSDANRAGIRLDQTTAVKGYSTVASSDDESDFAYATTVKACFGWESGVLVFVVNGASAVTQAHTLPTMSGLQLGNRFTTKNRQLDGDLKAFRFYPYRMAGADMQGLTA